MNWKALAYAILIPTSIITFLYIFIVVQGILASILGYSLIVLLIIGVILALYWAIDDEMRNKP